jgi:twitching motility protein PilT
MTQMAQDLNIVDMMKYSVERGASDMILTVGIPPQFKIHGEFTSGDWPVLTANDTRRLMYAIMNEKQQRNFEEFRDYDMSFSLAGVGRFRVNIFFQKQAVGGVLRTIPTTVKSLEEMGLPKELIEIADKPRGLVLITGPTGSGKSTTLAAMIDFINTNRKKHIMTIEDPVEFAHTHKNSIINQREIGQDSQSFEMALRAVLRQAPDVILVGEMRDYDTIRMAVTAAETGHLVMGTLHTNSAPESIDRIVDVFPEEQQAQIRVQLANNLEAVMTQQLLPKPSGDGRALAYELMIATPAVRALIREGKTYQLISVIQTGASHGMLTMDACLAALFKKKAISFEMGLSRAADAKEYTRLTQSDNSPTVNIGGNNRPGNAPSAPSAPGAVSGNFGRK